MPGAPIRHRAGAELVLTPACNLRCAYCYQDRHPSRRMSRSTVTRALDVLFDTGAEEYWVGFYGGEPLLAFDLVEQTVEEAERRCPPGGRLLFHLTTNGLLLDEGKGHFLATHGFEVQVSFDGSRTAQNLRAPGTYDRVSQRLRRLRRQLADRGAGGLTVAVTVTPAAVPGLAKSVEELVQCGVERVDVAPAAPPGTGWSPVQERELEHQMKRLFESALRLYRRTRRVPVSLFRRGPGRVGAPRTGPLCGVAESDTLTVDVDGNVFGCPALAHSYQTFAGPGEKWVAPWAAGPIDAPELPARLARFRSDVRESLLFGMREEKGSSAGRCRDCRFQAECIVCPAAIARGGPDPHRVPDYLCAFNRVWLSYRERFPPQIRRTRQASVGASAPRPSAS